MTGWGDKDAGHYTYSFLYKISCLPWSRLPFSQLSSLFSFEFSFYTKIRNIYSLFCACFALLLILKIENH